MRTLFCLTLIASSFLVGCSNQPETTLEQDEKTKLLEEHFDPRFSVINDRLGKHEFDTPEENERWLFTLIELTNHFNNRKLQSNHEVAIVWYDTESKKTPAELIAAWGPKTTSTASSAAMDRDELLRKSNDTKVLMLETFGRFDEDTTIANRKEINAAMLAFGREWEKRSQEDMLAAIDWANRILEHATPDGFVRVFDTEKWGQTTD